MTEQVEDFLAHYGVKGMRWGQRKSRDTSTSAKKSGRISPETRREATEAAKKVGKIALRYGAPLAVGATVGAVALPLGAAAAVTTKILSDPVAQDALRVGASASKQLMSEFGDIKLPDLPKFENPFGTKTTTRTSTITTIRDRNGDIVLQDTPGSSVPSINTSDSSTETTRR